MSILTFQSFLPALSINNIVECPSLQNSVCYRYNIMMWYIFNIAKTRKCAMNFHFPFILSVKHKETSTFLDPLKDPWKKYK